MEIKYSLFKGRHELPKNKGALFSDFNFKSFEGVKTENYHIALLELIQGNEVILYVTGLTPALTEFLKDAFKFYGVGFGSLVLMHYNSESGKYIKQIIISRPEPKNI